MNTLTSTLEKPSLLQAVLEGLMDGVLILTDQGEWLHANDCARKICRQLSNVAAQSNRIPQEIWRACEALINSLSLYADQAIIIENEITAQESATYRVRVQWLQLEAAQRPCILVTLEDRRQSLHNLALTEGQKYGLTPREADVWMRYRANYTYKQIASELFITQNTVKKHMKNIHAKRQSAIDADA